MFPAIAMTNRGNELINGLIALGWNRARGAADDSLPGRSGEDTASLFQQFLYQDTKRMDIRCGCDIASRKLFGRGVSGCANAIRLSVYD